MKRIISILLVLFIFCIAGCGNTVKQNTTYSSFYDGINLEVVNDYIVKDGRTDYKIVVPQDASVVEFQAAIELQSYVQQASGVFVPIIEDSGVVGNEDKYFSIGNTELFKQSKIDYSVYDIKADGFLLKNKNKTLYVMSHDSRGILYGVYEFLERILNIRFFAPDETYIPKLEEIPVYDMEIAASPYFTERTYMNGLEYGGIDSAYVSHSRGISYWLSLGEKFGGQTSIYSRPRTDGRAKGSLDHNLRAYVDPEIYEADHPEFFWDDANAYGACKMVDIVNGITEDGELDRNMPISVLKILIAELKKDILAHPEAKYFIVEQEDGADAINSERYSALLEKYGASGIWVRSMNVVCREIREWAENNLNDREINIVTFAYQMTKQPPVKKNAKGEYEALDSTVIPDKDLVIRMAFFPNGYYSYFDTDNSVNMEDLIGWSAICNNFMFWGYDIDFHDYLSYYPSWQTMSDNIKGLYEIGIKVLLIQGPHNSKTNWQTNIRHYVYSKLFWNYNLDVSYLIKEYVNGYYGEIGGEYVRQFMLLMDSHYSTIMSEVTDKTLKLTSKSPFKYDPYINGGVLTSAVNILREGIEKIDASSLSAEMKDKYLTRIYNVLATPMWMILNNYDAFYTNDIDGKAAYAKEFFDICDRGEVDYYNEVTNIVKLKEQYGI